MTRYSLNQAEDFMQFPTRVVNALLADQTQLETVVAELEKVGVSATDLKVLHGEAGRKIMDADGHESGILGRFLRGLENVSEVQRTYVKYVDERLAAGDYALSISVENEEQRHEVGELLKAHHSTFVVYFGRASIVDIQVPRDVAVL